MKLEILLYPKIISIITGLSKFSYDRITLELEATMSRGAAPPPDSSPDFSHFSISLNALCTKEDVIYPDAIAVVW